jgi:hypothetical protein
MTNYIKLLILMLIIFSAASAFSRETMGVAVIESDTPRAAAFAGMIENHIINISKTAGLFDPVPAGKLKTELAKFGCLEERCLSEFAARAGIPVFFTGEIRDRGYEIYLELSGYAAAYPHSGILVYRYRAVIPMPDGTGPREYSYIAEEHTGRYLSGFLSRYNPVHRFIKSADGKFSVSEKISGVYELNRPSGNGRFAAWSSAGKVVINKGVPDTASDIRDGDFIFTDSKASAALLENFYYGRKREIVFTEVSVMDTFFTALFTVPASASMPIASPLLGYYRNNDWNGLTLWALNGSPWIYMEARGLMNAPEDIKKEKNSMTRDDAALNNFGWYMLLVGGMPLFVDSYASGYLNSAANYQGTQPLMGNPYTAAFLSFTGGGGGYFYRGNRTMGYISFHLHNLLTYFAIRDFSAEENYDTASGRWIKGDTNPDRGKVLLAVIAGLRIFEAVHSGLMKDSIMNGTVEEGTFSFVPGLMETPQGVEGLTMNFIYYY